MNPPSIPQEGILAFLAPPVPKAPRKLMNAHGIRVRLAHDEDTGLPYDAAHPKRGSGVIRFWRWRDRSRMSQNATHDLEFTIPLDKAPCIRAVPALVLPGASAGVLQIDPTRDVFTAPEHVAHVEVVTNVPDSGPEQLHLINPKPDTWRPEP